jgi:hypothetical protein
MAVTHDRGKSGSARSPADSGHLLLDILAKILQQMESIGDLPGSRRTALDALRIKATPVAAYSSTSGRCLSQ